MKDHCGLLRPPRPRDVPRHSPVVPTWAIRRTSRAPVRCVHTLPTPQTTRTSRTATGGQLRSSFPPHPPLRRPAIAPFPSPSPLSLPPHSDSLAVQLPMWGRVLPRVQHQPPWHASRPFDQECIRYGPRQTMHFHAISSYDFIGGISAEKVRSLAVLHQAPRGASSSTSIRIPQGSEVVLLFVVTEPAVGWANLGAMLSGSTGGTFPARPAPVGNSRVIGALILSARDRHPRQNAPSVDHVKSCIPIGCKKRSTVCPLTGHAVIGGSFQEHPSPPSLSYASSSCTILLLLVAPQAETHVELILSRRDCRPRQNASVLDHVRACISIGWRTRPRRAHSRA